MQRDLIIIFVYCCSLIVSVTSFSYEDEATFENKSEEPIKPTCNCSYQVKFAKNGDENVFLTRQYIMATCSNNDDMYMCRLMCSYQMMHKRTYEFHIKGTAFNSQSGKYTNIVNEACLQQQQSQGSVDVRYELCENGQLKFLTFKFCCEMVQDGQQGSFQQDPRSFQKKPGMDMKPFLKNPDDFHSSKVRIWKYSRSQMCLFH